MRALKTPCDFPSQTKERRPLQRFSLQGACFFCRATDCDRAADGCESACFHASKRAVTRVTCSYCSALRSALTREIPAKTSIKMCCAVCAAQQTLAVIHKRVAQILLALVESGVEACAYRVRFVQFTDHNR